MLSSSYPNIRVIFDHVDSRWCLVYQVHFSFRVCIYHSIFYLLYVSRFFLSRVNRFTIRLAVDSYLRSYIRSSLNGSYLERNLEFRMCNLCSLSVYKSLLYSRDRQECHTSSICMAARSISLSIELKIAFETIDVSLSGKFIYHNYSKNFELIIHAADVAFFICVQNREDRGSFQKYELSV